MPRPVWCCCCFGAGRRRGGGNAKVCRRLPMLLLHPTNLEAAAVVCEALGRAVPNRISSGLNVTVKRSPHLSDLGLATEQQLAKRLPQSCTRPSTIEMATQCVRCRRDFKSMEALARHLSTSTAHHICRTCVIDFPLRQNLVLHYQFSPLHNYCPRCDSHFPTRMNLTWHLEASHNQCLLCLGSLVSTAVHELPVMV